MSIIIIGAGPAGLTAAYYLTKHRLPVVVLEQNNQVGGLARTIVYGGYRFDIGGHRFFTKNQQIHNLWLEILGKKNFLKVDRLSRIFYKGKFYSYPIKPFEALLNLGIFTSFKVLLSYFKAKIFPVEPEVSFENWVSNRFGRVLFKLFFKTYTEKIWGIPTNQLSSHWAAQRIRGLSLGKAVVNAFRPKSRNKKEIIRTLTRTFYYPPFGPGQMWQAAGDKIIEKGGKILLGERLVKLKHQKKRLVSLLTFKGNKKYQYSSNGFVFSSMPMRDLVKSLDPQPPLFVRKAAKKLNYRDFITVGLIIKNPNLFPDNWLYIHDPQVKVGRIQNYKNWSLAMVRKPQKTSSLGLEYFCNFGDSLWRKNDEELFSLAKEEAVKLGLVKKKEISQGTVLRVEKAYPVYHLDYEKDIQIVKEWLEKNLQNLILIGRNGLHRYNNQDHSMMTGLLAAKNILGEGQYDLWKVHDEATYDEDYPHSS